MIKRIIFDIDDTLIMFPKDYEIGYQKIILKEMAKNINQYKQLVN